ncbi:MAG TPA: hypothetical protein VIE65_17355 [Methylobacter sp.]
MAQKLFSISAFQKAPKKKIERQLGGAIAKTSSLQNNVAPFCGLRAPMSLYLDSSTDGPERPSLAAIVTSFRENGEMKNFPARFDRSDDATVCSTMGDLQNAGKKIPERSASFDAALIPRPKECGPLLCCEER